MMNTNKLNDWVQIAATIGVIAGLVLVAYEIRVSNRVGVEQATSNRFEKWESLAEFTSSPGMVDLFVRTHEGDELTRTEAVQMYNLLDTFMTSLQYTFILYNTQSVEYPTDFATWHRGFIQFYMGSDYGRRYWQDTRSGWDPDLAATVDSALAAPEPRDILAFLDYLRGATDQPE